MKFLILENELDKIITKCFLCMIILINSIGSVTISSSVKQLHIVFRHGERAPTETYKLDPYINMTWSGGWGQLTNRGKLEMYLLGLKLKELYGNFIPEYYYHKDVKILSSYADRCLMSAEILLAALFPPKGNQIWNENLLWQPIPVHYVPRSEDNLIVMKSKCKKYDEEFAQVLKSETFQSINAENQQLFQYLTKHTGQLIDNIGSVEQLYNTLEIELLHNLTLPSWTQNVSFDHMKYLAARYLEAFTETDYMKRMKGGVFLKEVLSCLKSELSRPFLYLYSAHDLTLVNILKTLGYKPVLKPGFGASFILEMRNNSEIIMTYRHDVTSTPEQITLLNCRQPCYLKNFKSAIMRFLPLNWEDECNSSSNSEVAYKVA